MANCETESVLNDSFSTPISSNSPVLQLNASAVYVSPGVMAEDSTTNSFAVGAFASKTSDTGASVAMIVKPGLYDALTSSEFAKSVSAPLSSIPRKTV